MYDPYFLYDVEKLELFFPNSLEKIIDILNSNKIKTEKIDDIKYSCHGDIQGTLYSMINPEIMLEEYITMYLGRKPETALVIDNDVEEPDIFIPKLSPTLKYCKSKGLDFCMIENKEYSSPRLVGYNRNNSIITNEDAEYHTILKNL